MVPAILGPPVHLFPWTMASARIILILLVAHLGNFMSNCCFSQVSQGLNKIVNGNRCTGGPRIAGTMNNLTVDAGQMAVFNCHIDFSCMVTTIHWFHAPENSSSSLIKTAASPGDPHVHLNPSAHPR